MTMCRSFLPVLSALLLAALAACGDGQTPTAPGGRAITLVLDTEPMADHGGFYQALALGLYAEQGLNVSIAGPGGGPAAAPSGAAVIRLASNNFAAMQLATSPGASKAVMAVFQKDPTVLITAPREGVTSIVESRDAAVIVSADALGGAWPWLANRYGFSDTQVADAEGSVALFLLNQDAVQLGRLTVEPYLVERELGTPPNVFLLADYDFPGYGSLVMVPQAFLTGEPDTVKAFVTATVAGWQSYLRDDPAPAHRIILEDNPGLSNTLLAQARWKLLRHGMVLPGPEGGFIGQMTEGRWLAYATIMKEAGAVDRGFDITSVYTLSLLPGGLGTNTP